MMAKAKRSEQQGLLKFLERCTLTDQRCLIWPGATSGYGYPVGKIAGNSTFCYIHKKVYEACVGEVPEGFQVDHICGNSLCLNPDHLRILTKEENKNRSNLLYYPIYEFLKEKLSVDASPF